MNTPNPGRVLVLGADGFLGRNLVGWLERQGHPFYAIGKAAGDLTDATVADAAFKAAPVCDLILHVVTRQRTGPVQLEMQGELLSINARIHLNVLEAWRRRQPQAMLLSTGSSCTYPESDAPITEDMFGLPPLHPSVRGYAQAKLILARGSELYGEQYGMRWLHCIQATLYGPHDHTAADRSHFFGAMLGRAVREKAQGASRFTVWGRPDVVRELLYVEDQIEALMAARGVFENRVLNCAANAPISIGESAEAIRATLKWDVPIEYPEGTFVSTPRKVLDSSVFLERTGWSPQWSLPAGIEATQGAG